MELQQALEQRYSVRGFAEQAPTNEQITAVLEAGRLSPTARNLQPQRIFVLTKEEDLEKLDKGVVNRYKAPVAFIIGYDNQEASRHDRFGEDWSFGDVDCTSVLVHMALKATDLGLGTCWLGAFYDEVIRQEFSIPDNITLRAVLVMGIPTADPAPIHTVRKPLEETVTWL